MSGGEHFLMTTQCSIKLIAFSPMTYLPYCTLQYFMSIYDRTHIFNICACSKCDKDNSKSDFQWTQNLKCFYWLQVLNAMVRFSVLQKGQEYTGNLSRKSYPIKCLSQSNTICSATEAITTISLIAQTTLLYKVYLPGTIFLYNF